MGEAIKLAASEPITIPDGNISRLKKDQRKYRDVTDYVMVNTYLPINRRKKFIIAVVERSTTPSRVVNALCSAWIDSGCPSRFNLIGSGTIKGSSKREQTGWGDKRYRLQFRMDKDLASKLSRYAKNRGSSRIILLHALIYAWLMEGYPKRFSIEAVS